MGYRTVVVLNNDLASEWRNDPELGAKIQDAALSLFTGSKTDRDLRYGSVVESAHADTQTVLIVDGLGAEAKAHSTWFSRQTVADRDLDLLKEFAEKMGYRLVKKSTK